MRRPRAGPIEHVRWEIRGTEGGWGDSRLFPIPRPGCNSPGKRMPPRISTAAQPCPRRALLLWGLLGLASEQPAKDSGSLRRGVLVIW